MLVIEEKVRDFAVDNELDFVGIAVKADPGGVVDGLVKVEELSRSFERWPLDVNGGIVVVHFFNSLLGNFHCINYTMKIKTGQEGCFSVEA